MSPHNAKAAQGSIMKTGRTAFAFASRLSNDGNEQPVFAAFDERESKPTPVTPKKTTPRTSGQPKRFAHISKQNSSGAELFHVVEPSHRASDIVLGTENFRLLSEIVEEFRKGDEIRRFGLRPRSKLLFCGPPGCGKTLCAEVLAYELKMPLLVTRLDSVITTFLGETASNLRKLFDAAASSASVLFLDEFDAVARTRTDATEHNEIRRVVNSLLMMIEEFQGRGLMIAATNLQGSIDEAAWRRFDEVIYFKPPNRYQILKLLRVKTRNFPVDFEFERFLDDLEGMSFAEIERICIAAIKREIVSRKSILSMRSFSAAILDERRRIAIRKLSV